MTNGQFLLTLIRSNDDEGSDILVDAVRLVSFTVSTMMRRSIDVDFLVSDVRIVRWENARLWEVVQVETASIGGV